MAFSTQELESIADSTLDYFMDKGEVWQQAIQEKPLLAKLEGAKKSFPGGKEFISLGVKGDYGHPKNRSTGNDVVTPPGGSDEFKGFSHNDQVKFYTPANNRRVKYAWKEHHIGLTVTHTELKVDGLSVADTDGRREPTSHSGRDQFVLKGLLESKYEDFAEQRARGMNGLLWGDGSADAKGLAGLRSILTPNGALGTVGALAKADVSWWRNRARTAAMASAITGDAGLSYLGGDAVASSPTNGGVLLQVLQAEWRQLRRYGGRPNCIYAGSDFIGAMEVEMRANGNYSDTGFTKNQDGSMGEMKFKGTKVLYDPTLDDLSLQKRAYIWDDRDIYLVAMEGEWNRKHSPSRPHDYFTLYRSITCTGQLVCRRLNSALVIDIK